MLGAFFAGDVPLVGKKMIMSNNQRDVCLVCHISVREMPGNGAKMTHWGASLCHMGRNGYRICHGEDSDLVTK